MPVVWRKGSLNNTLIDRQNWMATSENTAGGPDYPSRGARQVISLSTQISRAPACAARRYSWTNSSCDSWRGKVRSYCRLTAWIRCVNRQTSEFCNN